MELVDILEKVIDDKKGENIVRIDFKGTHAIMDQMIVTEASNSRLMLALIDAVEEKCDELGYYDYKKEGNDHSDWVLFYVEHIAISVFLKDAREYYNIERLWKDFIVER